MNRKSTNKNLDKTILNKIKQIILSIAKHYKIEIDKLILFGSRARGDYKPNSDWDILIVTKDKLLKELEDEFWVMCNRKLYDMLRASFDILIIDKNSYEKKSRYLDEVYYYAKKEGIKI